MARQWKISLMNHTWQTNYTCLFSSPAAPEARVCQTNLWRVRASLGSAHQRFPSLSRIWFTKWVADRRDRDDTARIKAMESLRGFSLVDVEVFWQRWDRWPQLSAGLGTRWWKLGRSRRRNRTGSQSSPANSRCPRCWKHLLSPQQVCVFFIFIPVGFQSNSTCFTFMQLVRRFILSTTWKCIKQL